MPSQATEDVELSSLRHARRIAVWSAMARRHAPDAVLVLAWILFLPICLALPWASDLGLHLATVGRLEQHLTSPGNPVLQLDTTSPYYSPYTVSLALLGIATKVGPLGIMKLAGLFNLALVLTGVRALTRRFTVARWAPPLVFLLMMLLWGTRYIAWSGFFSAASLAVSISYPSTFALGLLAHIWSLVARATGRGAALGWLGHAGIGVLFAILTLSHQFTAVGATLGIVCLLASRWHTLNREDVPRLALGLITALVVLLVWPYYHFWQLGSQMRELDPVHRALYHPAYYWLGVVALPALFARWRRDHCDPLVLISIVAGLVVAYGWFSGHYSLGRTIPEVILPLQIALGVELAGGLASNSVCREVLGGSGSGVQRRADTAARRPQTGLVPGRLANAASGTLSTAVGGRRARAQGVEAGTQGMSTLFRASLAGLTVVALVLGAFGQSIVVTLDTSRATSPRTRHVLGLPLHGMRTLGRYGWITRYVRRGDVVLTDDYAAREMSAAYGAYLVAPPWYDPELPESQQLRRIRDVAAFFAPGEPARSARRVLRDYRVDWIITPRQGRLPAGVPENIVATGPGGARLIRVAHHARAIGG
jgi:alpha-1,6-mannosyltransferase